MNKTEPRTLPGFMELLPQEQILFNQIKDIEKYGKGSRVIFNNGKSMVLPISYYLLNNQYYRASLLKTRLFERIKEM